MAWTWPTALFFATIVCMLLVMGVLEVRRPTRSRRGWLPIETTRGDRLFIGLLTAAFVNMFWILIFDISQWPAFAFSLGLMVMILRKG